MTRQEEQSLIELAVAGDRSAAERLIRAHQASLYAYLLRLSGRADVAEDIAQDAFVRVLTNLERFDPRFRFSTWLFTIAKRLYVNANQKYRPVYDSETVGSWKADGDDQALQWMTDDARGEVQDAIGRALSGLTEEQREIIVLFHQQEWPISLIAEYMGMPEGTVKSHLHRGRKKMRRYFEQHTRIRVQGSEVQVG